VVLSATIAAWNVVPGAQAVAAQARTAQPRPAPAREDGEALFRAVFFLQGPLADQVPELRRLKSLNAFRRLTRQQQDAIRTFQTSLIRDIKASNPTFFDDFAKELQTKDRTRISRALVNASQVTKTVVLERNPDVAGFLSRNETALKGALNPVANREYRKTTAPDLKAINRVVSKTAMQEAERTELVYLKGFKVGGATASDPDTDHSIAIALLTFIAVFVIIVIALPITAETGGDLYHEKLVNSLAIRR
jgi:SdpC family antimicrobial peptide